MSRISSSGSTPFVNRKFAAIRQSGPVRVVVGVIDPQDVERAGVALVEEPAEIVEVMDEPEARNAQGEGGMGARRFEPGEERPIERPFARTEIASEKIARRGAVGQPRILKKAAVDQTRRLGRFADRAAHPGRLELALAHLAARPARRSLEPGGHAPPDPRANRACGRRRSSRGSRPPCVRRRRRMTLKPPDSRRPRPGSEAASPAPA